MSALGQLGSACYRHRWVTVLVWIAGVAALITLWTRFGAPAQNDFTGSDPGQVFLSFVLTPDVSVKQIGLGLAAAVLVDATVVRLVLVPAVMELLGRANWWLPSWLARLLPGGPDETRPAAEHTAAPTGVH
jgi:uncharacterized membrane protein YdfJ with MMPL/SSD domain